ncbi:CidA/LrgA family protein [Vibrio tritonius]|uniref:CidA/LrgA family protein n=1 Tax=Vibrio tritonius TaxID=1435069 RepID=A0ABS7YHM4_9VIBR|nr:CidA/LrgA family protein [Vibrio tritonius]MCA2014833.1 CidA/LrgA family protein [Vibrio tritonius]
MNKIGNGMLTIIQVIGLSVIWFAADYLVKQFHLPIPSNLTGLLLLLVLVFARIINVEWLRRGATWLLAEMLLFFVPAVVTVVNYQSLMEQEGLQIIAVLFISTALVIGVTAWVVDRVYRFEVALSRRKSNRRAQRLVKVGQ